MNYPIWYKQSGFQLTHQEWIVYLDPWEVPDGEPKADFIFITHAHEDHFDRETIARLGKPSTVIICPADVAQELTGTIIAVRPGEKREIDGLPIETVPAYNIGKNYHPKAKEWVGYIIDVNGTRFYHAGDTDHIPEMRELQTDIAMLPIGGTYTMNVAEAAEAARDINPKKAIPMHYGFVVGSHKDGERFRSLAPVPVDILTPRIAFVR